MSRPWPSPALVVLAIAIWAIGGFGGAWLSVYREGGWRAIGYISAGIGVLTLCLLLWSLWW